MRSASFSAQRGPCPAPRRQIHRCPDLAVGVSEVYSAPFKKDGVVAFAFNSQKRYIAIYGLKSDALEAHRAEFAGAIVGKGCIR